MITPINTITKLLYSIPFGFVFVDGLVDELVDGLVDELVDGLVDGLVDELECFTGGLLEVEASFIVVGLIKFVVDLCDENLLVGNSCLLLGKAKLVKNDADLVGVTWIGEGLGDKFLVDVGLITTVEYLVGIVGVDVGITPVLGLGVHPFEG